MNDAVAAEPWRHFAGVGPRVASRLANLGIERPEQLLTHVPLRYEDRTRIVPMGALVPGTTALVAGEVLAAEVTGRRRAMLLVRLADGTGYVTLRFFHFRPRLQTLFRRGSRFLCFGEIRPGSASIELVHPSFKSFAPGAQPPVEERLTPVYPTVAGLAQSQLRRLVDAALAALADGRMRAYDFAAGERDWPEPIAAFEYLHHPPPRDVSLDESDPAVQRLAFDELLAHHVALRRVRRERDAEAAPDLAPGGELAVRLRKALPFRLTRAQEKAVGEILRDLAGPHPMRRLLHGDVGSGKTVVAALAAAQALGAGYQAALMAPTELLAEQHYRSLATWFEAIGADLALITAETPTACRRGWQIRLAKGEPLFLVGTHALIANGLSMPRLALAVIDEQHRFGVDQRLALASVGAGEAAAHQLVMTATPIPRTLAMTLYADLDVSTLDERPPGRKPVATAVMSEAKREDLVQRIGRVVASGRQAYWVCPLIQESDVLEAQAAEKTAAALGAALPSVTVGLLHGRLPPAEKDAIMRGFLAGEIHLLVATTVIEVGVDVPNATLMVIENAERLGLAQLHQLRGRIGRGTEASHCLLLYHSPLSVRAKQRLAALRRTDDGFEIAEADLRLRGPGELIGTRQAGLARFRIADLARDRELLARVPRVADRLIVQNPREVDALMAFWLGPGLRYANA